MSGLFRVLIVLVGLVLLAGAWVWSQIPRPDSRRVEAALDVVGIDTGGSFAWILRTPHGAALIDAGLDRDASALLDELRDQGLGPEDVHTILITHGHRDHWGGAAKFPKARIYAGPGEGPLVRGERQPKTLVAEVFRRFVPPAMLPASVEELKGGETLDLDGTAIRVVHVPGHTPGTLVFLRGGLLFTGDALLGRGKEVIAPPGPFSEDPALSRESLRGLLALPFTLVADGHSGVVADARQKLARLLGHPL